MRIDKSLLITGDNRADTGSMLSRLETGDVISAKVLEISPKEAVLRLTDGTVIKARTLEQLDVKPGQTILLTVTSRSDNSFVLETLKSISRAITADSAKLFTMLETAGIKPDDQNLKLAAEFLKYDTVPTSEMITAALESMRGPGGLDIEKAVYLAVKNINTAQSDKEMLSGLLDGDLKLGRLLDSLLKALSSEAKDAEVVSQNPKAGQPAGETLSDSEIKPAQQAGHSASQATEKGTADSRNINTAPELNTEVQMDPAREQKTSVSVKQSDGEDLHLAFQVSRNDPDPEAEILVLHESDVKSDIKAGIHKTELSSKSDAATNEDHSAMAAKSNTGRTDDNASKLDTEPDKQIAVNMPKAKDIINKPIDLPTDLKKVNEYSPEEALQRISKSIDRLFVKIHKQLSGDELDPANIRDRILDISKELKILMQSPDISKTVDAKASLSLNLLEDTVKLLDMFNSSNVLYYQIPIKNDNNSSTAELYVMKRHKNRKKIDPNDLVLFLSLDTINLGRFETILDVKGRNISMSLRTENQAVSDFARANIKSLYTALSDSGYKLTDIKYSLIGAAATPLQQEKLLTDAVRLKHGRVDLRI